MQLVRAKKPKRIRSKRNEGMYCEMILGLYLWARHLTVVSSCSHCYVRPQEVRFPVYSVCVPDVSDLFRFFLLRKKCLDEHLVLRVDA